MLLLIFILSGCGNKDNHSVDSSQSAVQNPVVQDGPEETEQQTEPVKLDVSVDITELYHTHVGDAGNLYFKEYGELSKKSMAA